MTDLAPCPFCGGEAVYDKYLPYDGYQREGYTHIVYCRACHAAIKGADEEVVAKWNGRALISMSDQADLARLENIALGSLIRKLEDIVRENEGIVRAAEEDRDREVWDERDEEETGGKVMTHKQNLFKMCFRMSDGQVFEKEFRSFAEAVQYVHDVKGLKALFCIGGKTFEDVTWINPRQIVSAEVTRVL